MNRFILSLGFSFYFEGFVIHQVLKILQEDITVDEICPRTCNRIDISYKIKTIWYNLIQRVVNSAYRSQINLDYLDDDFVKNDNNNSFCLIY